MLYVHHVHLKIFKNYIVRFLQIMWTTFYIPHSHDSGRKMPISSVEGGPYLNVRASSLAGGLNIEEKFFNVKVFHCVHMDGVISGWIYERIILMVLMSKAA